jgi:hypothetical protein
MLFAIIAGLTIITVAIGLDVYLALDGIKGNTWSEMIRSMGFVSTFIPWVWGVLSGHFFHPNWQPWLKQPGGVAVLIWLSFLIPGVTTILMKAQVPYANWLPFVVCLIAALFGGKLWPC